LTYPLTENEADKLRDDDDQLDEQEPELEDDDMDENDEDDDDDEKDSDDSSTSFLGNNKVVKAIKKNKKVMSKTKTIVLTKIRGLQQLIIFALIIVVVLMWGKVESVLHWIAGQDEIVVVSKTMDNGCPEIVTEDNESYCVDTPSYDLAVVGEPYLLEEYQYHFKLREDK